MIDILETFTLSPLKVKVELIPSTGGKSKMEHISNIKYIMPTECYKSQIPDYETFGRQMKLCLNPHNIPNLS